MAKQSCPSMLEDLLYEAVDAGAANRDVNPQMIGRFYSKCVRTGTGGGLARRRRRKNKRSR